MPHGNSKPPFKTLAPVKLDTRRRNGTPVSEVIIKPAEKGGAVVVWDRDLYIAEAHRQLDDNSSYQSLPVPSLPHDQKTISVSVNKLINNEDLPSTANFTLNHKLNNPHSIFYRKYTKSIPLAGPSSPLAAALQKTFLNTSTLSCYPSYSLYPPTVRIPPTHSPSLNRSMQHKTFNHSFFSPWMWYRCTPPSLILID